MLVTYYGHSCFLVETKGIKILFDPFITPNPLVENKDISAINPDYMLISHGHEDHVADAISIAKNSNATCIGIWETHVWLNKNGITKTHPMNIGGSFEFDFGTVKMVEAVHSSSFADGSNGGNCAGFVIQNETDCFYFAGDTALTLNMQLIAKRFSLKCAFLPIGGNFTMDAVDAVEAAKIIDCKNIIGMHYDTFGYIKIDKEKTKNLFEKNQINLHLMEINSNLTF